MNIFTSDETPEILLAHLINNSNPKNMNYILILKGDHLYPMTNLRPSYMRSCLWSSGFFFGRTAMRRQQQLNWPNKMANTKVQSIKILQFKSAANQLSLIAPQTSKDTGLVKKS